MCSHFFYSPAALLASRRTAITSYIIRECYSMLCQLGVGNRVILNYSRDFVRFKHYQNSVKKYTIKRDT